MLKKYFDIFLRHAKYEILQDDGLFYGEIPECNGVYANANSLEGCREQLEEVLKEWILFRINKNLPLPIIESV
jgi:predicted RNase H-like HicB family nuclease